MRLPDDVALRLLDRWPVARLATLGEDGAPHQVPIVFALHDGRLWSAVDAKPKSPRPLVRVRNIERDPRVSLLVDHYDPDWTRLFWLRIDGRASVLRGAGAAADPEVAGAVAALRRKYPQYDTIDVLRDPATLIAVRVDRVTSWCADPAAIANL